MSKMVTLSIVTGTNLFLFLFRLKWFGMNKIRKNSELCFCFLFGIRLGTTTLTKPQKLSSWRLDAISQIISAFLADLQP